MQNWGSTMGFHLCILGAQKCSFGASKRAPIMQFWGLCMAHNNYRIRAPYRASWCRLGYVLLELFLYFYLDETRGM